ncbi:N-acetylmuramic acid 6-phosphate etherase [Tessaracoccus sp. SD287]|uniref:N-acetylmuramic acid 6-phosphate etherase n=1 Tax=Tessaracoccus sp. SD287 TaxID=2782008 RepID=UPI001A96926F|nr:N-acetylmuramic acid 6-phosphate etherase [Tessaracoccus sp. SD287]MBO1032132.1 N-acetylmuramic acid 6-phosphate etherase [Tessaracoccus sp. SD287]
MALTWSTEQRNPDTMAIDTLPSAGIVEAIVAADLHTAAAVAAVQSEIARAVDLAVEAISAGGRMHYVGAGTSGRLGVLDAVELYPTYRVGSEVVVAHLAGGADAMMQAVEGAEDDAEAGAALATDAGEHDLFVGIAASGRTPFVRGALEAARARGLATVLISNNPAAPIAEHADVAILPDTGPEVVTGSTRMKAATAQKMVINTLSTATMIRLGKTYENLMINVVATNAKLEKRMVQLVVQASGVDEAVAQSLLAEAQGDLRVAVIAALAGAEVERAVGAAHAHQPDPHRAGDPSGVRAAVAMLRR